MSNPSNAGGNNSSMGIREGTRVVLREITANLQNSPPGQPLRRKSGNEAASIKGEQQHDVKVRFIREFADVGASSVREANTESSLSSASSFQSLTSTLSSKCSSGICVDSSPAKASDTSYQSADIPGLDDLISACENIRLTDKTLDTSKDQSFSLHLDSGELSDDQTFTSAIDKSTLDRTRDLSEETSPAKLQSDVVQEPNRASELSAENSSAKLRPELSQELNRTRELSAENSPAKLRPELTEELNRIRELSVENSPAKLRPEFSQELNRTRELSAENSPAKLRPELTEELNRIRELSVENSPAKLRPELSQELNRTRELSAENSPAKLRPELPQELNRTRELEAEDSPLDFAPDVTRELSRTRELSPGDSPLKFAPDVTEDLDRTRELSAVNSPVKFAPDVAQDLDRTRELCAATSPEKLAPNSHRELDRTQELAVVNPPEKLAQSALQELDSTRTFDGEIDGSIANAFFECATVNNEAAARCRQANSELDSVNETFVLCVSDVAQLEPALQDKAAELAKKEKTAEGESDEQPRASEAAKTASDVNSTVSIEDFASDSTVFESIVDIVAENAAVPREEVETAAARRANEPAETPARSLLDVTVGVPLELKEILGIEPSDFEGKEPIPLESLSDLVVDDIPCVDSLECYEPLAPALSDTNADFECPTLPTLSSVCLRATLAETDDSVARKPAEDARSAADVAPAPAGSSLLEKFAHIAANDVSSLTSISTIKEPTFLNAQKLADDSAEPSIAKNREAVESIDESTKQTHETVKNADNPIELPEIEFCEFKKPEQPAKRAPSKVPSPELSRTEASEGQIGAVGKVERERQQRPPSEVVETREADSSADTEDLNDTLTIEDISAGNIFAVAESEQYAEFLPQQQSTALTLEKKAPGEKARLGLISDDTPISKAISPLDEYAAFVPQQQSTALTELAGQPLRKLERQPTPFVTCPPPPDGDNGKSPKRSAVPVDARCNFEKIEIAARAVANDIYVSSPKVEDEHEPFVSASSELFHDPGSFDFFLSKTPRKNTRRDLRAESLYVKFDPLVSNTSMLPQGNIHNTSPPANEEQNGENNATLGNIGTPKRSPAIAAIDRLLFYSPMTTATTPMTNTASIQKANDSPEKAEPTEETSAEKANMAKELELVRSTVIQLEEQLESYQEKINQLQSQLAQEIKNKNQITVVVDEYEKSISRLVAERERDRKNLDLEKAKLQEELAAAKHHLDNTEAAFNDVHLKYERLKAVVTTYKSNEVALKQSVQENVEIIKSLENRYEQVKEHATARLEKANQDLDAIQKQNEAETVKLHAMLRKAELKSNSLAELVEQKTKENKELTQILDEVIARVGRNKSD